MKSNQKIAIIILAAGASRRLGHPKQLVEYKGQPLLHRMINACQQEKLGPVHLILGAKAEVIRKTLVSFDQLQILKNPNWAKGMSNTVAFAAREILIPGEYDAACFVLSDQIHFEPNLLFALIKEWERSEYKIVISKYKNGQGPPSLFDRSLFSELVKLEGDNGAKAVVKKNKDQVAFIDFPQGFQDVDTPDDLEAISN